MKNYLKRLTLASLLLSNLGCKGLVVGECYDPSRENPYTFSEFQLGKGKDLHEFPSDYKMNSLTFEVFKRRTWPIVGYDWKTEDHYDLEKFKDNSAVIELARTADKNSDGVITREEINSVSKKQSKAIEKNAIRKNNCYPV